MVDSMAEGIISSMLMTFKYIKHIMILSHRCDQQTQQQINNFCFGKMKTEAKSLDRKGQHWEIAQSNHSALSIHKKSNQSVSLFVSLILSWLIILWGVLGFHSNVGVAISHHQNLKQQNL